MPLTEKFPVGLNFANDSDNIQLTNSISLGESWTVETWFNLPSAGTENSADNLLPQKLITSNPQTDARFGNAVAVSGNIALVGAYQEDNKAGAAYIFELNSDGTSTEKQKLIVSDSSAGDLFGRSVAINGNIAIVGADDEDTGGKSAGAAYIFERDSAGTWTEKAKIQASDKKAYDNFGYAVSISNNYAIVGAYGKDTQENNAGAAYIFERDDSGTWTEKAKIQARDAQAKGYFGNSVTINGNFAIVGAWQQDTAASDAGAAYIFERDSSGNWTEKTKLVASDAGEKDYFGRSVAISNNFALVGADNQSTGGKSAGAAYIFERDDSGNWTEKQKLQANDKQEWDNFGYSLGINGNTIIVGAYGEDTSANNAGAAYLFERDSTGTWTETKKLQASEAQAETKFGNSVAIGDNFAIVGAYLEDIEGNNAGAAYIFAMSPESNSQPVRNVLVGNSDGNSPVVIQDQSKLGTVVDGVFYDSGYNLGQLTPGWHHMTAVAQDTTTKFYIDGQKIADVQKALSGEISTIGNSTSGSGELGKLAEVRLWNRNLNESEIAVNSSKVRLTGTESGLAAYYPLNEATGNEVVDRTNNNNNGTVAGTAWWCGTVPVGNLNHQAMQFDGVNDYIDLGDGVVVGDHFTQEAWIYSTITDNGYHGFLGQHASKRAPSIWVNQRNRIHGDLNQAGRLRLLTDKVLFANTWNHVAVTYDGDIYKVYVNGEECYQKNLDHEPGSNTPIKYIGKVENYFKGQIAEVRIWNKTRSREEIQADMHQRLTGNESDLVAYLPLNQIQAEGDTQKVLDLTSNNNHGTIHGATLEGSNTLPILGTVTGAEESSGETAPIDNREYQVIQLDGTNDYIEVSDYKGITGNNSRTIEAWIKTTVNNAAIVSWGNNLPSQKWVLRVQDTNGTAGAIRAEVNSGYIVSKTAVNDGQWHHVACTFDSANSNVTDIKLYVDGQIDLSETNLERSVNTASGSDVRIGIDFHDHYFNGEIAEVRIWNTARTESEIKANMNQRLTGNESGMAAYFPLDEIQVEGDTQKILDRTSNNNHGIVHGATLETSNTLPIV